MLEGDLQLGEGGSMSNGDPITATRVGVDPFEWANGTILLQL